MTTGSIEPRIALFGSCGQTTYRRDILIPYLQDNDIPFFDPQVPPGTWQPDMAIIEDFHLSYDAILTWTITAETPSLGSLQEINQFLRKPEAVPRPVIVYLADGPLSNTGLEWQQSQSERQELADIIAKEPHARRVYTVLEVAVEAVKLYKDIL